MRLVRIRARVAALGVASLTLGLFAGAAPAAAAGPQTWNVDAGTGDATGVAALKFYPATLAVNAGDSITWKVVGNAHTIAFLTAGQVAPSPDSPTAAAPAGGTTVDGSTFTNSGIVVPAPGHDTYTATLPTAGTFVFHCLIHPGMNQTVTVNAAATAYPQDQAAVTAANQAAEAADITAGHALEAGFTPSTSTNADGSTTYHLAAGVGANRVSILRYISQTLDIKVGDTVEWTNGDGNGEPHSVSFGKEPKDPSAFAPAGGKTYNGKAPWVSSGLYLGAPLPGPHSYSLKFTKAGTFHYLCVLHDIIGMKGTITVAAAPAQATPPPTSTEPIRPATNSDDAGLAVLLLAGLVGLCGATVLIRRRTRAG